MAVSAELDRFCRRWLAKAKTYPTDDVAGAFDQFFTLYVAFNRLYAEATFRLARRKQCTLEDGRPFPDSKAAREYVVQYCRAKTLTRSWEDNEDTRVALGQIADHLRHRRFALKLHMLTGEPNPEADVKLLADLESRGSNVHAKAGLEVLYAIRCNMFHGHKGFEPIQIELLRPAISLLESTIEVLYRALQADG